MSSDSTPDRSVQRQRDLSNTRFVIGGLIAGGGFVASIPLTLEIIATEIENGRPEEALSLLSGLRDDLESAGRDEQELMHRLAESRRLSEVDEFLHPRRAAIFAKHFPGGELDNAGYFRRQEPFIEVGPSDTWVAASPTLPEVVVSGRGLVALAAMATGRDIADLVKSIAPKLGGA